MLVRFQFQIMLSDVVVSLTITVHRYLHKPIGPKDYPSEFLSV